MNGIQSIPSSQYHAAAGVSRSMLEELAPPKTPAHFKAKYIDKVLPDDDTEALMIGTLTHRQLFEPDTMEGAFYVSPDTLSLPAARVEKLKSAVPVLVDGEQQRDGDKIVVEWNNRLTEAADWNKEHADKPVLTSGEAAMLLGIRKSVMAHPKASAILKASEFERSAFVDDGGLLLKARFDALPRTGNVIADLKTCNSADLESVEKSMFEYGYFRQAAFYLRVANLLGMKRDYFVFIFVEKSPPYAVACYTPTDEVLTAGEMMVSRDLQLLRNCYAEDKWPGYSEGIEPCALPPWAMKQIEATQPRA